MMMNRLRVSWTLFVQSLCVIRDNKKLLLFHFVLGALLLALVAFYLLPFGFVGTGHGIGELEHWSAVAERWLVADTGDDRTALRPLAYVLPVAFYLSTIFAATFVNVAFMHEALGALNGRPVSVSRGLAFAGSRLPAVLAWSLLAGVVGVLIKALEEYVGWIGQWVLRLVGVAWSVAAIFVVPVIVREGADVNPLRHLRASAVTLRRTWGESLIGFIGINLGFAIAIAAFLLLALAVLGAVFSQFSAFVFLLIVMSLPIAILAIALLTSAANQIYRGALYIYATEGVVPGPFDPQAMDQAWKLRAGRRARSA